MKKTTILVTHNFKPHHLQHLDDVADSAEVLQHGARTSKEVNDALNRYPETEVLYTIQTPTLWSPEWQLTWIQLHYAGVDHVRFDILPEHVEITTASGVNSTAIAEHTFTLILALQRRIPDILALQSEKSWPDIRTRWHTFARPLLQGSTIGILGYGSIGREVARMAKAFGMAVLAYKRNPTIREDKGFIASGTGDPGGTLPDAYYDPEHLLDMMAECDVVVNSLPATPATRKLITAESFGAMKPTSLFINIGRGTTVDEEALIGAIETGQISGVGLDVFATEPLPPDSPLWTYDNVIISPHVGGFFAQYDDTAMELFCENVGRYLAGRHLLNRTDRNLGY